MKLSKSSNLSTECVELYEKRILFQMLHLAHVRFLVC